MRSKLTHKPLHLNVVMLTYSRISHEVKGWVDAAIYISPQLLAGRILHEVKGHTYPGK